MDIDKSGVNFHHVTADVSAVLEYQGLCPEII